MNKLLKGGTLACVLMAYMAGGQSAATLPVGIPVGIQAGTHAGSDNIDALMALHGDVRISQLSAIAVVPTRTVKNGDYTLITGTDVREAVEAAKR
ncbi:MAG: hypothetical protein AAF141_06940 [Pseudomonadota bacterium]